MSDKIIVPTLGESVTEATVSKWLKSQGEKVSADDSGLSKREWNELMSAFNLKDRIV